VAPLFPDEAKRLKLGGYGIRRAKWMAAIAESQRAISYRGQVVFDRTRLNRYKKLAAAVLSDVLRRTRRPRILVALPLQEIDPSRSRRNQLVGKADMKRVSCAVDAVFELAPSS
jgi:hypothetical protein